MEGRGVKVILDPAPPHLHWVVDVDGETSEGWERCGSGDLPALLDRVTGGRRPAVVGCVAPHGGDDLTEELASTTPGALEALAAARRFSWDGCHMSLEAARAALAQWPEADHWLLCETALFSGLPGRASRYAVPEALGRMGLRRYGGNGLAHRWVERRAAELTPRPPERVVSVHLGDIPDVAALQGGMAVETTIGFTPMEGLPSMHSCGDIDPTIALQLCEAGYTPAEVADLLSRRSGLSGLLGRDVGMAEVAAGADSPIREARELLVYGLTKAVGASAGAMGGVDALVFSASRLGRVLELARAVSSRLDFLDLVPLTGAAPERGWQSLGPGRVAIEASRRAVLLARLASAETASAAARDRAAPAA